MEVAPIYKTAERTANFTDYAALIGDSKGLLYMYKSPRYIHLYSIMSLLEENYEILFIRQDKTVSQIGAPHKGPTHIETKGVTSNEEVNFALILKISDSRSIGFKQGDMLDFSEQLGKIFPEEMPIVWIGDNEFRAEIATGDPETARGLMFRPRLSGKDCMLFVFSGEHHRNFWMRNTLIPLTVLFVRTDLSIDSAYDMDVYDDPSAQTSPTYGSKSPCRYVIEINKGALKDISEGMKARLPLK